MKHLIFGAGNIGLDIEKEIKRQGGDHETVEVFSQGTEAGQFDVRDGAAVKKLIGEKRPDYVWYCVGFGSVEQAEADVEGARTIYGYVPLNILNSSPPDTKVILFSSDYCSDPEFPRDPNAQNSLPESMYAQLRIDCENQFRRINRPNSAVIRIGSIYGTHKPLNTFPGRVIKNYSDPAVRITLPLNESTPTSSLWLAAMLYGSLDKLFNEEEIAFHHCAPEGNVSARDWGKAVLKGIREPSAFDTEEFYDEKRPRFTAPACDFLDQNWNWMELFNTYFKPEQYQVPDAPEPETEGSTPAPTKTGKRASSTKASRQGLASE